MKEKIDDKAKAILDNYLESNRHRKTPERYAILEAVCGMEGHFTLEELNAELERRNFRVSRATIYNAMRLFIELRLVLRHSLRGSVKYEARYSASDSHVHQVCTICGVVAEIPAPLVAAAVKSTKLTRFRKDTYALYIYGVCSSCQAKLTRKRKEK